MAGKTLINKLQGRHPTTDNTILRGKVERDGIANVRFQLTFFFIDIIDAV
jgi:hypothetical protein